MIGSARQTVWFRIGLCQAFLAAMLPVLVALFHLLPAPALGGEPSAHRHAIHGEAHAAPTAEEEDDCHPAGGPHHQEPQPVGPHCPLCLWLKTFHVLPPPDIAVFRLPSGYVRVPPAREPLVRHSTAFTPAQPRAPPFSPAT